MPTKEETLALSKKFAAMGNRPLTQQGTSDAWNERQNRLASSRDAAHLQIKAAMAPDLKRPGVSTLIDHSARNVATGNTVGNSSISTMTFGDDQFQYLIPTIYDGKRLKPDEAIKRAQQFGLDKFPKAQHHQELDILSKQISNHLGNQPKTEVLPEELASVMGPQETAPQSWDRLMTLRHARTKEQRLHPSGSRLLKEIDQQMAEATKDVADALGRIKPGEGAGSILPDLGRHAKTVGGNILAQTLGLAGDIQDISAFKVGGKFGATKQLPGPEELAEKFGGDVNHPSWLLSAIAAPGPQELKVGIKSMAAALKAAPELLSGPKALAFGMTFFHGSGARKLQGGNFDLRFIGQGEGEQVRGHGIYFAEREGIGRHYQNQIGGNDIQTRFQNSLPDDADFEDLKATMDVFSPEQQVFLRELEKNDWFGFDHPSQAINAAMRDNLKKFDASPELKKAAEDIRGTLFKVDVADDIVEGFIDLDGQLLNQSDKIRDAFRSSGLGEFDNLTGENAYRVLAMKIAARDGIQVNKTIPETMSVADLMRGEPGDWYRISNQSKKQLQEMATNYLKEQGIDGMKFRDAASRGGVGVGGFLRPLIQHKKRTNNLVVFNPEVINRIENSGTGEIVRDQLKLTHYSKADNLKDIDPIHHGTGLKGAESKRKAAYPEVWVDRSYFGLEDYKREAGLGSIRYDVDVDKKRLYDLAKDPDGLFKALSEDVPQGARTSVVEKQLKEQGWLGYWVGDTAAVFEKVPTGR